MSKLASKKRVAAPSVGYLELLRSNRAFRFLWFGQVVSQMGDWFDTIAVYTIALTLTGSTRSVALIMVARFLPSVVIGPLSGVVADRFSRRTIMIASDIVRAIVVLGFLFVRRPDQMWLVYVLTVLQLAFSTFFEPAKTAVIPSIVSDRELVPANAIASVTWSVMLTLGAAIGGFVAGSFGTNAAFVLDSLTFLASAMLISTVRFPKRVQRPKTKLTVGKALGITDTIEGAHYVRHRPRVLAYLLVKTSWGVGGGILTLLAVFGERIFPVAGKAATGIGVLFTARGIGTAVGPIVARRWTGETRKQMQTAVGIAFLMGGTFYIAFAVSRSFAWALVFLAVAHMGGSILWVFSTVLLQKTVEDNFRGRVFAAEMTLVTLTMATSNYVVGELMDRFGISPRWVTAGVGIFFLMPGITWFLTRQWWDRKERTIAPVTMEEVAAHLETERFEI
ncbi:MAG TPA: MFS transporter [Pyrinomonadaceae bacterium]|jgi:MFS family permease|nr:MFS transporter [Pyrinomonadaceae bacterium]